ncbi:hypothetical protein LPTSP3_g31920 [Leptospira kobayashii]|uniref:Uncharacterized protein n=1 Tax=Leptospira kobayashii TaxID=1917830 RepID=A0ABN6KLX5_9LEPT|nr:hypothetical protein [Leptospira kobayashii]BDA80262.1 hypothetical protein LPTSP3_g31920 [Leptospira kobayashii]
MSILKAIQFPFLLTALLGLVGLQTNYWVGLLLDAPILELEELETRPPRLVVQVTNLTMKSVFHNLVINMKFDQDPIVTKANTIAIPPSSLHRRDPSVEGRILAFYIPTIQPGQSYHLEITLDTTQTLPMYTTFHLTSSEAVLLKRPSFETFLLRHHILLNAILLSFWSLSIGFYFWKINKHKRRKRS